MSSTHSTLNRLHIPIPRSSRPATTQNHPQTIEDLERYATLRLMKFQSENTPRSHQSTTRSTPRSSAELHITPFHSPFQTQLNRPTEEAPYLICLDTLSMAEDLKKKLTQELREQFQAHLKKEVKRQLTEEVKKLKQDLQSNDQPKHKHRHKHRRTKKSSSPPLPPQEIITDSDEPPTRDPPQRPKSILKNSESRSQPITPRTLTQMSPQIYQSGNWIVYDYTNEEDTPPPTPPTPREIQITEQNLSHNPDLESSSEDFRPGVEVDLD